MTLHSLSRHASQPSFVAALASVACISSFFDSKNNAQDSATLCEEVHRTNIQSSATKPMILTSSPISNGNIVSNNSILEEKKRKKEDTIVADYIVIGYGKTGQSAVRTIKQLDPTAHIVIIDPSNNYLQQQSSDNNDHSSSKNKRGILNRNKGSEIHLHTRASYINHNKKLISIHPINNTDTTNQSIRYRKSVLIATGSRAAPPPESCVRQDAKDRILELRSTSSSSSSTLLDPTTVRSLSIMAASQLATVSIMGSGFEALELAAYCARVSQAANGGQTSSKDEEKKVQLLFGNAAPLSNILPRYLSAAVSKRLRQNGIQVEERALTRYISLAYDNNGIQQEGNKAAPKLEIYTVKSYDSLDSKQLKSDLLVYAPSVDGNNGTAVLPTNTLDNNNKSTNYLPWSSLVTPPILTSYLDDGRLVTNAELQAASSIYAAGSCANYPNLKTGQLATAGGRHVSAHLAGKIAARNMVSSSGDMNNSSTPSYIQESIPVWRSDVIPYLSTTTSNSDEDSKTLALFSMGIHSLCVGKCDSESMATHGFWWTNQSSSSNGSTESSKNGNGSSNSNPNRLMKRATRSSNTTTNLSPKITKRKSGRGSLPVYGSGVVYYLNRSGGIEGIMLWGLPYSKDPNNAKSEINNDLVQRLKNMIRSNGSIAIEDHSDKISRENGYGLSVDIETSYLLSYLHLAEESKHLASMALSGTETSRRVSVTGRPLHRYTPIKSVELTNLGKMTRHDETGQVSSSEDLFYTSMSSSSQHAEHESGRPPSLKRIYPMQSGGTLAGTKEYELEKDMARRQLQIERSRPSKEEPLWLRPAEEYRLVNRKDALADSFARNIQRGIFADGQDSVRQAPVPRVYLDAKQKWSNLMSEDSDESDVDE